MNLILFLALAFAATFVLGKLLERIKTPWIFGALLIGLGLSAFHLWTDIGTSPTFIFLAQLGMYFLLFIIGFELDIKQIFGSNTFVIHNTFLIISAEAFFGTLAVHYLFGTSWLISGLVAVSFATVGEAVLLPILDEFNLTKKKLGQTILGIGVLDDVIEIITIIVATVIIGKIVDKSTGFDIWINLGIVFGLFALTFVLIKFKKYIESFKYKDIPSLFLFAIFMIFLFIGIGLYAESAALGAILAGIALKNFMPKKIIEIFDSEIRTMAYGFFAPIFFLWVGMDTDVGYLIKFPLLIIALMAVSKFSKIGASYLLGRKYLGPKKSIIMGIGLCVKFSTSIVIIKLLFDNGLIQDKLFSILIGTTIAFKFIVPFLMSYFIRRWKIDSDARV